MDAGWQNFNLRGAHRYSAALILLALPAMLSAQTAAPTQQDAISLLTQQVQQLQQQDRELQERIRVLEASQKTAAPTAEPLPVPSTAADAAAQTAPPAQSADQSTAAPTSLPEMHEVHAIQWRGFGEADYRVLNQRQPELATYGFQAGSAGNFYTGDFGLFLTSRLTGKASVLSEIIFGE